MNGRIKRTKLPKRIITLFIWLLLTLIIIRSCAFDIFHIPSDSMKNTLEENNLILINKISYHSPLSKVLSFFGINAVPKTNDIMVFKINQNDNSFYVKRCIGLPGEIIQIDSAGNVIINEQILLPPITSCRLYKLTFHNYTAMLNSLSRYKLGANDIIQKYPNYIVINLDYNDKKELSKCRVITIFCETADFVKCCEQFVGSN